MFTPTVQASNTLLMIAHLQQLIISHLHEIACCRQELPLCITDSSFSETDRQPLKNQIRSLKADVAQWREEIRCYKEQYAQLTGKQSVASTIPVHRVWDAA
jgi:hypothetical protein